MQEAPSRSIGFLDAVDPDGVHGWAQLAHADGPADVRFFYEDREVGRTRADRFRPDLLHEGYGDGRRGFRVPLPCPPEGFDPRRFSASLEDGVRLSPSEGYLAWTPPRPSPALPDSVDLLASPCTPTVHLEFTSHCNLRCVYCAVSQPDYQGSELALDDFDTLVDSLKARRVASLVVNGHGETTAMPRWQRHVGKLADAGFDLAMISNFARPFRPDEIESLVRVRSIQVSVDTHKPDLLKRLRRQVSLGTILVNMAAIRTAAGRLGHRCPEFSWSCVVSDQVASDLADFVRFGLACGVRHFDLCNLQERDPLPGAIHARHVSRQAPDALRRFKDALAEARSLVMQAGGSITVQAGLEDTVDLALAAGGALR